MGVTVISTSTGGQLTDEGSNSYSCMAWAVMWLYCVMPSSSRLMVADCVTSSV